MILLVTCPIRMASGLRMEQKSVKMYIRYKNHKGNLCIIEFVISMLFLSPNMSSKNWSLHVLSTTMELSQAPLVCLADNIVQDVAPSINNVLEQTKTIKSQTIKLYKHSTSFIHKDNLHEHLLFMNCFHTVTIFNKLCSY